MDEMIIRLHFRRKDGTIDDAQHDLTLAEFAGVLPSIGDEFLDHGVASGLPRNELESRRLLRVVRRIFNPRDHQNYVALIVEEHPVTESERTLIPAG